MTAQEFALARVTVFDEQDARRGVQAPETVSVELFETEAGDAHQWCGTVSTLGFGQEPGRAGEALGHRFPFGCS